MTRMVAMDVAYGALAGSPREVGVAGAVVFEGWDAAKPRRELTAVVRELAPYVPGRFFERELPCLQAALAQLASPPELVIVDGYVWLDDAGRPGLGAELYRALGGSTPVVGVAKKPFRANAAIEVLRGASSRPLYVTAAGMDAQAAAERVRTMHGPHRLPAMLKRADAIGRRVLADAS